MKALELNVYPKLEYPHDGNTKDRANYVFQYDQEWRVRMAKRLTDAELAAEMFSAVFHEAECEVRGMRIERGYPPHPAHPAVEHYVKQNREFGRQADILRRFATLPHYDEVTA